MRRIIVVIGVLIILAVGAYAYVSQNGTKPTGTVTATPIPPVKSSGDVVAEAEVLPFTSAELSIAAQGIVAEVLALIESELKPGVTTGHLDMLAERHIRGAGAIPSFKGYLGGGRYGKGPKAFPASTCPAFEPK